MEGKVLFSEADEVSGLDMKMLEKNSRFCLELTNERCTREVLMDSKYTAAVFSIGCKLGYMMATGMATGRDYEQAQRNLDKLHTPVIVQMDEDEAIQEHMCNVRKISIA